MEKRLSCADDAAKSQSKGKWKYNFWKNPDIEKPDKILAVVYIVGTLFFPVSAIIWLIVIWFVRGRKLPLLFKQFMSVGLIFCATGAWIVYCSLLSNILLPIIKSSILSWTCPH